MKTLITIISMLLFLVGCQSTPDKNIMITSDMLTDFGPMPAWTQQAPPKISPHDEIELSKTNYYVKFCLLEVTYMADVEVPGQKRYVKITPKIDTDNYINQLFTNNFWNARLEIVEVDILSAPSIFITDGELGKMNVGSVVPYLVGKDTVIDLTIGMKYYIRIKDNQDDKKLDLDILTEVNIINEYENDLEGNLKPIIEMDRIGSSVKISSGQTALFGGVIRDEMREFKQKIPYLAAIPFTGDLFTYNEAKPVKKELILIVTPKLIEKTK